MYPSDLTDKQRELVESLLPAKRKSARPRGRTPDVQCHPVCKQDRLPVAATAQAIPALEKRLQHILAEGPVAEPECRLAHAPAHQGRTQWRAKRCHHRLPIGQNRLKRGQRGYDTGKKIKGRKRHIVVDTMGFLLAVLVHSAGIQDMVGARAVFTRLFACCDSIRAVFADGIYRGHLPQWVQAMFGWRLKVVKRTQLHRFVVLPRRWVVERSFAWMGNNRRLSKDYEVTVKSAQAFVCIAFIRLMLARVDSL